jgi:hypothetical protein
MSLQSHGQILLRWDADLLYVDVMGPFNMEGVTAGFLQIQHSVSQSQSQSQSQRSAWARIDVLDKETLGAPEVMKVIGASYKWCLQHDCVAIASVCSTSIQWQILEQTRQISGMNLAGFATLAEAEQWCREQLTEQAL